MAGPVIFVLGKPADRTPVIADVVAQVGRAGHQTVTIDPKPGAEPGTWTVGGDQVPVANVVAGAELIVQRGLAPEVLAALEPYAQRCCNDPVATALVHERISLLHRLAGAGIGVPDWREADTFAEARRLANQFERGSAGGGVIKDTNAQTGRGAGVLLPGEHEHIDTAGFAGPYLVQAYASGWEAKLYVFGEQVAGARRDQGHTRGGEVFTPQDSYAELARETARAVGLELCGVDLIMTSDGPLVIDVNPFPSAAKIPGAADLISHHVMTRLR